MLLLRFIGENGDYGLRNSEVYPCKVYTKNKYIWVKVRNYGLKFPKRYISIPYCYVWRFHDEWRMLWECVDD